VLVTVTNLVATKTTVEIQVVIHMFFFFFLLVNLLLLLSLGLRSFWEPGLLDSKAGVFGDGQKEFTNRAINKF